jgi:hypothetical protein
MPERRTVERARQKARAGKSPSTQAGEFVREEIHHVREGKHGARSVKQAIAIGLSKARRAGVKLGPPPPDSEAARKGGSATRRPRAEPSARRARGVEKALRREPHDTASHADLAKQAHRAAVKRGPARRHASAMKAVRTKGAAGLHAAARKAARTRQARQAAAR